MPYFRIFQSYLIDVNVESGPPLPDGVSFLDGALITETLPDPLLFTISIDPGQEPVHLLGGAVPIISKRLIDVLTRAGVDNYQLFPARLVSESDGREWLDFFAFNVIGMLAAIDPDRSKFETIMPGGALPPVVDYEHPVIDEAAAGGLMMFRDAGDPTMLIVHADVVDALAANKPPAGWGVMVADIESAG